MPELGAISQYELSYFMRQLCKSEVPCMAYTPVWFSNSQDLYWLQTWKHHINSYFTISNEILRLKDTNWLSYPKFYFPPEIDQFSKWKSCSGEGPVAKSMIVLPQLSTKRVQWCFCPRKMHWLTFDPFFSSPIKVWFWVNNLRIWFGKNRLGHLMMHYDTGS